MDLGATRRDRSAIILAGGEGMRLRSLTRRIAGDERPKQFCSFVGGEPLLDRTRARVARAVQYGWIEAGDRLLDGPLHPVHRVRRFWEKPREPLAQALFERGCLWNSFVLVARVPALLALIRAAVPDLHEAFTTAWLGRGGLGEGRTMRALYARIPSTSFSDEVLENDPARLAVLPVRGVPWSDWGDPSRALRALRALGIHPAWVDAEPFPGLAVAACRP